jgi:hypothetical protein
MLRRPGDFSVWDETLQRCRAAGAKVLEGRWSPRSTLASSPGR